MACVWTTLRFHNRIPKFSLIILGIQSIHGPVWHHQLWRHLSWKIFDSKSQALYLFIFWLYVAIRGVHHRYKSRLCPESGFFGVQIFVWYQTRVWTGSGRDLKNIFQFCPESVQTRICTRSGPDQKQIWVWTESGQNLKIFSILSRLILGSSLVSDKNLNTENRCC